MVSPLAGAPRTFLSRSLKRVSELLARLTRGKLGRIESQQRSRLVKRDIPSVSCIVRPGDARHR